MLGGAWLSCASGIWGGRGWAAQPRAAGRDVSCTLCIPAPAQVNSTLDSTPAKVQEQSQDMVTSKQGFVPLVLNSPSPRAPYSPSHPYLETSPAATPLPAAQAVPRSPCAIMLMPSWTVLSQSLLPQAHLPQVSRTWAAVHSTNLSPSPAETQEQLGLIRQEIRSLQEELPLLEVEENVGAVVDNVALVLEQYREPIISLDGLR